MVGMEQDFYRVLGVGVAADFSILKRAYYQRAKLCHPDRFGGDPAKTREFQLLVEAFDTLSDPDRRRRYDAGRSAFLRGESSPEERRRDPIMDTEADDILEELIVGNRTPPESSLQTLLADLEKTETFLKYREGRNYASRRRWPEAEVCFRSIVERAPYNIVFRVHLARSLAEQRFFWSACRHYLAALRIGRQRIPEQRLERVHLELNRLFRGRFPFWCRLLGTFRPKHETALLEYPAEAMIRQLNRALKREEAIPAPDRRLEAPRAAGRSGRAGER